MSSQPDVVDEDDFVHSDRISLESVDAPVSSRSTALGPLQRYRIVAPLGKGGMAEVFLAAWEVAPHVQRPVVIKRLYAHLGDDPNLVQMFIDEARLSCGLDHENIVKTIEVGAIDDHCCIAMEYLAGQALQQVLRHAWSRGGLPVEIALHIAIRALDALCYAHEFKDHRGSAMEIVHRDISPHNIFITNSGHVKLLDFGIAKATTSESRTATGYIKGKLAYIAPEQARSQPVDCRADIWSIGVVLWEMLSGTRLFRAESDAATLAATLEGEIVPPSSLRASVPTDLDRIVLRALQRDPSKRYPSAWTMKCDLEEYTLRTGTRATTTAVARMMNEYFSQDMVRQRKMVFDLLEQDTGGSARPSLTPVVARPSGGTRHTVPPTPIGQEQSEIALVTHNHRLVVRTLMAALLCVTALGVIAICLLVLFLRQPARSEAPRVDARPEGPLLVQPITPQPPRNASANSAPSQSSAPEITQMSDPPRAAPQAEQPVTRSGNRYYTRKKSPATPTSESPTATVETGLLNFDSTPWSLVSCDGKALGQTPLMGTKLSAGTHLLTLRNPDLGLETQYTVLIEAGKTVSRRVGLQ